MWGLHFFLLQSKRDWPTIILIWEGFFFKKQVSEKNGYTGIVCLASGSLMNGREDCSCQKNSMAFWHFLLLLKRTYFINKTTNCIEIPDSVRLRLALKQYKLHIFYTVLLLLFFFLKKFQEDQQLKLTWEFWLLYRRKAGKGIHKHCPGLKKMLFYSKKYILKVTRYVIYFYWDITM